MNQLDIYLDTIQEFEVGYKGPKYVARTADYIRTQLNKDPNQLSFLRFKRGEVLIGAGVAAVILIGVSIKAYKRYLTKIGKACRDYTTGSIRYKVCATDVKLAGRKKQLSILTGKKGMCKDTKDPSKCKSKIDKHISKVGQQIKELEARKKEYNSLIGK